MNIYRKNFYKEKVVITSWLDILKSALLITGVFGFNASVVAGIYWFFFGR